MRFKFRCDSITEMKDHYTYHLSPVYSQDPMNENKYFWEATPSGSFQVTISKDKGSRLFVVGEEYYLDFNRAQA